MAVTDTALGRSDLDAAPERARAVEFLTRRHRFRLAEALPWILALAAYFIFPDRMTFGSQVLLMAMFALSLDLILGFAGIVTLGHAAFFGIGAYTVGLLASKLNWGEPISGLVAAAAVSALAGAASGWLLLRYRGLALLVLTLATTFILQELGNVFDHFTGGYDGLPGLEFWPLLGAFTYDLYGHTVYLYTLAVLFVVFLAVRRIVYSPFGQSLTGIRENVARMHAIGAPVHRRLLAVYTIAAAIAGIAGALFTETNAYVTLGVFDFDNSAGVMVMLILGGTGRLYGAFVGAVIYMVLQDHLAKLSPAFWQAGVGLLMIFTVLFARRGLFGLFEDIGGWWADRTKKASGRTGP
jgi:branched-chain amino acid transport system permease protein